MNAKQVQAVQRLIEEAEAAEDMRGDVKVTVGEAFEWEDEGCIEATAWAGGVGALFLIDADGALCDCEDGPGHPVRLVVVPDKYGPGNKFSYDAVGGLR